MNLTAMLTSPAVVLLLKWAGLLILSWWVHGFLRRRDARWRLILWRSVLGFSLLLPLSLFVELPGIHIPLGGGLVAESNPSDFPATTAAVSQVTAVKSGPNDSKLMTPVNRPERAGTFRSKTAFRTISWKEILVTVWVLGCLSGMVRLTRLQLAPTRLRKEATEPAAEIEQLARQIGTALKLRRDIQIRTTGDIGSPFVCDLLRPTILLPRTLIQSLTPEELRAVLNHEMAHIRQNDLAWCVAWQWLRVFCWFNPLVWRIPAAHNLACEQEADRAASRQMPEGDAYVQLLARLALKVLALPAVETRLTVNGSSQIAKRLNWLGHGPQSRWNWRYSLAGLSMSLLFFLVVAGCKPGGSGSSGESISTKVKLKQVLVVVQDDQGKPVAGATISPEGFRVKGIHGADAYTWRKDLFGPAEKVVTDANGKASIKYPVIGIPEEKEYTGELFFSVSHPDYATARPQEYSVDTPEQPIRLTRGIHLTVSGYIGGDHQPVPELAPILNEEEIDPEDWQMTDGHAYAFNKMSPGAHLLRLMGQLPSGQIVYSEVQEFTADAGQNYHFDLEMKPGIRLEGRLDDNVPRPVTNGRVLIAVRSKDFPAWTNWDQVEAVFKKYQNVSFWNSFRPIAPDGTFVFESVPPGGLDVIVHGDGFVSQNGGAYAHNFAVPETFPLESPSTSIVVATEPTATLEFTAKTKDGKPIEGAWVGLNPNVIRIGGGLFGDTQRSSEAPFNKLARLPDVPYSAKTGPDGVAVIRNVPARADSLEVDDPRFQVPLQDIKRWRNRVVRLSFTPGETNQFTMVLEPKGTDFIGTGR